MCADSRHELDANHPRSLEYLCPGMSNRKVHFSVPIHHIEYLDAQWNEFASQFARDGSAWLRMGADRQRFRDRIERTAEVLNRILDFELRQKIYVERFENFVISSQTNSPREQSNLHQEDVPEDLSKGTVCELNSPSTDQIRAEQTDSATKLDKQIQANHTNRRSKKRRRRKKKRR